MVMPAGKASMEESFDIGTGPKSIGLKQQLERLRGVKMDEENYPDIFNGYGNAREASLSAMETTYMDWLAIERGWEKETGSNDFKNQKAKGMVGVEYLDLCEARADKLREMVSRLLFVDKLAEVTMPKAAVLVERMQVLKMRNETVRMERDLTQQFFSLQKDHIDKRLAMMEEGLLARAERINDRALLAIDRTAKTLRFALQFQKSGARESLDTAKAEASGMEQSVAAAKQEDAALHASAKKAKPAEQEKEPEPEEVDEALKRAKATAMKAFGPAAVEVESGEEEEGIDGEDID